MTERSRTALYSPQYKEDSHEPARIEKKRSRWDRDGLFGRGDPVQNPVLALGGFFQHALVDAFLLGGRRVTDELREWSRGDGLGFAFEGKHGLSISLDPIGV